MIQRRQLKNSLIEKTPFSATIQVSRTELRSNWLRAEMLDKLPSVARLSRKLINTTLLDVWENKSQ